METALVCATCAVCTLLACAAALAIEKKRCEEETKRQVTLAKLALGEVYVPGWKAERPREPSKRDRKGVAADA